MVFISKNRCIYDDKKYNNKEINKQIFETIEFLNKSNNVLDNYSQIELTEVLDEIVEYLVSNYAWKLTDIDTALDIMHNEFKDTYGYDEDDCCPVIHGLYDSIHYMSFELIMAYLLICASYNEIDIMEVYKTFRDQLEIFKIHNQYRFMSLIKEDYCYPFYEKAHLNWDSTSDFVIEDNILYGYNIDKENNKFKNLVIPNGIITIADDTFKEDLFIEELYVPSSVKSIGDSAFSECRNLKEIKLEEGLKTIGDSAFELTHIDKMILPKTLKKIGYGVFPKGMTLLEIPSSINSLNYDFSRLCFEFKIIFHDIKQLSFLKKIREV